MSRAQQLAKYARERIYVLQVDVPRCKHVHGSSPCTATETGDAKCYNTLATCNDLANYDDYLTTFVTTLNANASNGTFQRFAGSFLADGFDVGQVVEVSGFTNAGNNSEFTLTDVTATTITVSEPFGMVTESFASGREIKTKNLYSYRFCESRVPHPSGLNFAAPCISGVSIQPSQVKPSGGIGARASVSISMNDFPEGDLNDVDPYLADRTFNPYDVGLFFLKWRQRNATYENYNCILYSGFVVDNAFDEANFDKRYYVLSKMAAGNGEAAFQLKDPLQLLSNKKALAPAPSSGKLISDITAAATSATLEPTGVGNDEYPASGYAKIRSEVVAFTRSGDNLTLTRAQFNTQAEAHSDGDTVQICLEYDGTKSMDLVQGELCTEYAGIPARYIPRSQWATETDTYLNSNPNRLITDPTPVDKLIGQLCEAWPHKLLWNERSNKIQMEALKAPPASANTLTQDGQIMELSSADQPNMQVSTVFVKYGQFDPTKKIDESDNYQVTFARVNGDAAIRYGVDNAKTIYCPWIPSENGAAARRVAQLIGRRFGITPRQISFTLDDKDSALWIGDVRNVLHHDLVDSNGKATEIAFEVISASERDAYEYKALEYTYDKALAADDEILGNDVVDLSISEQNINLRSKYESIYGVPDADTEAVFIVYSGVIIGSSSTGTASLVTGSWPAGATIKLQVNTGGYVVGKGADGSSSGGVNAGAGGDAISLSFDLTISNSGIIGGGGGGGGAAEEGGTRAGGGGGAGNSVGLRGGDIVNNIAQGSTYTPSQDGTLEEGGDRGIINETTGDGSAIIIAGNGGDLGQAGSNATAGNSTSNGGAAGKAVDLNGNTVTYELQGDIRGAVS